MNTNSFKYNKEEFNTMIEEINNFYYSREEDDDDDNPNKGPNMAKKVILPVAAAAGAAYAGKKIYDRYKEHPIPDKALKKGGVWKAVKSPIKTSLKIGLPVGMLMGADKIYNGGQAMSTAKHFVSGIAEIGKHAIDIGKHAIN